MVQFQNGPEAVYTVIRGGDIYSHTNELQDKGVHAKNQDSENKKKNRATDDGNRTSKLDEEITENTDDTDDTDGTDDTIY